MKNTLIFSNPFGNGPAGKAISIAKYIIDHSDGVSVFVCGGSQMESILGDKIRFIKTDERSVVDITKVLNSISGPKFVISSQNRFAIKAAVAEHVPCAFLDGLAWFWKTIPEDHLLADIIFWLNYPGIQDKIPSLHKGKIEIIHGITEQSLKPTTFPREGNTLLYLGGCLNPLTSIPTHYLDLFALVIQYSIDKGVSIDISTDPVSKEYLKKYPQVFKVIENNTHDDFISKLSQAKKFITNGGQTATLEAFSVSTPILFFLPINLSQYALINNLKDLGEVSCLQWDKYIKIPDDIFNYNEKDAINLLDQKSFALLSDKDRLNQLCEDFMNLLIAEGNFASSALKNLGTTGAEDIYNILKKAWGI